jgi:modification methylase
MVDINFINGDSRQMKEIADASIQLIVTSPPYYDLKNYDEQKLSAGDQIGSPDNFDTYLENLNAVWSECVRGSRTRWKNCCQYHANLSFRC